MERKSDCPSFESVLNLTKSIYIEETGRLMLERIKKTTKTYSFAPTQTSAVSEHLPSWKEVEFIDCDPH